MKQPKTGTHDPSDMTYNYVANIHCDTYLHALIVGVCSPENPESALGVPDPIPLLSMEGLPMERVECYSIYGVCM